MTDPLLLKPASILVLCLLLAFSHPLFAKDEAKQEYAQKYKKAEEAFYAKDYLKCLELVDLVIALQPKIPLGYNLKGQTLIHLKRYDEAILNFEKVIALEPKYQPIAFFNLGESYFLKKDYQKAKSYFEKFQNTSLAKTYGDLGPYEIFLCNLLLNEKELVSQKLNTLKPTPKSPFYYFAKAAVAFHQGNTTKGKANITSAQNIYSKSLNSPFIDPLINLGWITSQDLETEKDLTLNSHKKDDLERMASNQAWNQKRSKTKQDSKISDSLLPELTLEEKEKKEKSKQ